MDPSQASVDFLGDATAESLFGVSHPDLDSLPFLEPLHIDYNHNSKLGPLSEISTMSPLPSTISITAPPSAMSPCVVSGDTSPFGTPVESQVEFKDAGLLLDRHAWQGQELIQPRYLDPFPTLTGDYEPRNTIHLIHQSPIPSGHPSKRRVNSPLRNADPQLKGRCVECGKFFTDLKAHMLTKQTERPEKCPVPTCEYHTKGFARKYDRARHTLTHFRGTIVCGFCSEDLPAEERSFENVNAFKRHLTREHDIEKSYTGIRQRRRAKILSKKAKCQEEKSVRQHSACQAKFQNAQDLYDHLDDCVLGSIQREDIVLQT